MSYKIVYQISKINNLLTIILLFNLNYLPDFYLLFNLLPNTVSPSFQVFPHSNPTHPTLLLPLILILTPFLPQQPVLPLSGPTAPKDIAAAISVCIPENTLLASHSAAVSGADNIIQWLM